MTSITRRAVAAAAVAVIPLVTALAYYAPNGIGLWSAWGVLAIGFGWAAGRSLSRRIGDLTAFANQIPNPGTARPRLPFHDDELGDLARSLARTAPQVERVVQGLSTELARREAILASMREAVLAVDAKLNVSFCNDSFIREVAGHPIAEGIALIKVFRDPGLFQALRHAIDSGETVRRRLNMSAQEERWFEVYATPLAGTTARGALAILQDVTMMERLERAQRDFVANVSHEFRTPLATITGCAETLLDGALDDQANRRKFLELIQANSIRLNNIAADLITLSQLDGGRPRIEPAPIAVEEVVASVLRAIEPVAGMQGVKVQAAEICSAEVLGYRIAFEQVLGNLLDNAVKFNKPSGEVVVKAIIDGGDRVEISVSDTGIGIPAEDLSRIFERFYRVDKARSRQVAGTGLGLSIVKRAVEQMHGTVHVDSQPGKGSRFAITLPRHPGSASS